jgi:L-threonylcarbamoyladenylate synthase
MVSNKPFLDVLRRGGVLLLPTETGWCLAADATHEAACARVRAAEVPGPEPATVLLAGAGLLDRYLTRVPDLAPDLIEFAEKPLTIVFAQGKNVAPSALGPGGSLALRVVKSQPSYGLLEAFGRPVLSVPAAAPDGTEVPPPGVDAVWPAPAGTPGTPATIVRLGVGGEFEFLRK